MQAKRKHFEELPTGDKKRKKLNETNTNNSFVISFSASTDDEEVEVLFNALKASNTSVFQKALLKLYRSTSSEQAPKDIF